MVYMTSSSSLFAFLAFNLFNPSCTYRHEHTVCIVACACCGKDASACENAAFCVDERC
eukprot:m.113786 g.113786  ORF g.113786 m.113786 type:complete len:58 (+) comp14147_c2_seq5:730-903(+)